MNISNMAHQRQIDDEADIEVRKEQEREYARERLLAGDTYEYLSVSHSGEVVDAHANLELVSAFISEVAPELMCEAMSKLDSDPLEAVRMLRECKRIAANKIVDDVIDFDEVARLCIESDRREVA